MTVSRTTALSLLFLLLTATAFAQTDKDLADLKALFERDPAAGFVEAQRMFEVPRREGDLEGMMAIIRIVGPQSRTYWYGAPLLVMAETALPLAEAQGDWVSVGNLYEARTMLISLTGTQRTHYLMQRAADAYARAGKEPEGFAGRKAAMAPSEPFLQEQTAAALQAIAALPDQCRRPWEAAMQALDVADDAAAERMALQVVEEGHALPTSIRRKIIGMFSSFMSLPGMEAVLPQFREWVLQAERESGDAWVHMLDGIQKCCGHGWSGTDDEFYRTFYWCHTKLRNAGIAADMSEGYISVLRKLLLFGRRQEADVLVRYLLSIPYVTPTGANRWAYAWSHFHRDIAPDLRRGLVKGQLEFRDWYLRCGGDPAIFGDFDVWRIAETAPPSERATWCIETGYQIADYASNFPTAASRSRAATEAAAYFTKAGRADLAAQARDMAAAFAADDPKVKMQVALAAGQSSASQGKWEDVVKGLEPVLATAAPSGAAVQAALLLRQAQANLGKKDEAAAWLTKAGEIPPRLTTQSVDSADSRP